MGKKGIEITNLKLSKVYKLTLLEDKYKNYVRWGKKNDYNSYLTGLADNQAEHGAIPKTKAIYLNGLCFESDNQDLLKFIEKANPNETFYELSKKINQDKVMFGAVAIKVVPNLLGMPLFYYHVPYGNLRVSKCGKQYQYCDDWQGSEYEYPRVNVRLYNEGDKKPGIIVIKDYFVTDSLLKSLYGRPSYQSALTDIDSLVRISTYYNTLIQTDFNKRGILTVHDDNPTPEKKAEVARGVANESGEEAPKGLLLNWAKFGAKAAELTDLSGSNLDKQYEVLMQNLREKIIIAHEINPALAGLSLDGKLGQTNKDELKNAHELYIKKWAIPEQETCLRLIERLYKMKTKQDVTGQLKIKQLDWLGEELPLDNQNVINAIGQKAFTDYVTKKFNIDVALVNAPANTEMSGNDFVSKLNMRELNRMFKIVANYHNPDKSQNLAQTITLLQAYGLNEQQAKEFIKAETDESQNTSHVQQSAKNCGCGCSVQLGDSKDNLFVKLAYEYAHDINNDDEILEVKMVGSDDIKLSGQVRLAKAKVLTLNQLRNAILNQFKGNPELTAEEMSDMFNVEFQTVQEQIEWLISKKLLQSNTNGFNVSEKGINKKTKTPVEIYTEYYYDLRDGMSGPVIITTTREFCKKMYKLHSENKKALTLKQIERIKNEFGDNALVYSGGFYNNGQFIDVKCRHAWFARTKI